MEKYKRLPSAKQIMNNKFFKEKWDDWDTIRNSENVKSEDAYKLLFLDHQHFGELRKKILIQMLDMLGGILHLKRLN